MQTMWDSLQQIIRILLYAGSGALVTAGVIDQATGVTLAGALLGVINGLWTWYWNRKQVVTVAAADAPTSPISPAAAMEIKAAKR